MKRMEKEMKIFIPVLDFIILASRMELAPKSANSPGPEVRGWAKSGDDQRA